MKWPRGELFRITGLYLLIIPFLNALNATGYVNSQIQGYFGASSTEFMYMNLIPVFALIAGLPLVSVLFSKFQLRSLMFTIIIVSIVLNTCSAYTTNMWWYTAFRAMLAFFTIFGIVAAIAPIVRHYNPKFNMAIMYGIVQFIIQGSSHLYKFLGAHFAQFYDWKTSLLLLNINFFLCIILTLIFIKSGPTPPKKPLQFDFKGWLILILFLIGILFLTAEGQNREWFSDSAISLTTAIIFILIGMYIFHSRGTAAPLIDLGVFKYKNVVLGTLFFFLIGALNSTGSVVMGFMGGVLGFNDLYMAETHLYVIIGLIISIPVCTYMLFHRVYLRVVAITGFLAFTFYHVILYFRFYPGITIEDFILPLIFKGMGIGFLYVLSSLYISENIPKHLSTSRMMSGILARNVLAMLLGASVLSTIISQQIVQHKTGISQQLTNLNESATKKYNNTKNYYQAQGLSSVESEKMATKVLQKDFSTSAAMVAYKDIYLAMAAFSFIPILLILLLGFGKRPVRKIEVDPIPI